MVDMVPRAPMTGFVTMIVRMSGDGGIDPIPQVLL
jgi:hypothetical protein